MRKFVEPGPPPDQRPARKAYGEMVDEMIAHPTLNQRCWNCKQHHGLVCVCSRAEKKAAYAKRNLRKITPGTYR